MKSIIVFLKVINSFRIQIITYLKRSFQSAKWRMDNTHNYTSLSLNVSNPNIIKVGNHSYGEINIETFENKAEALIIGNYVSIASNVLFILGGNHQINTFSTYPIKSHFIEKYSEEDSITKGTIVVEDEVWIGNNVIILSGVKIGKGSIVAAGSIVTKDVMPFSIVGGIPSNFIKWRIQEELIPERMKINLSDFDLNTIIANKHLFYRTIDLETLNTIKRL